MRMPATNYNKYPSPFGNSDWKMKSGVVGWLRWIKVHIRRQARGGFNCRGNRGTIRSVDSNTTDLAKSIPGVIGWSTAAVPVPYRLLRLVSHCHRHKICSGYGSGKRQMSTGRPTASLLYQDTNRGRGSAMCLHLTPIRTRLIARALVIYSRPFHRPKVSFQGR